MKMMEHVRAIRKLHGDGSVGVMSQVVSPYVVLKVYTDLTGDSVLRFALSVDFLDTGLANVWGINPNKSIITEFSVSGPYYMEGQKVIHYRTFHLEPLGTYSKTISIERSSS